MESGRACVTLDTPCAPVHAEREKKDGARHRDDRQKETEIEGRRGGGRREGGGEASSRENHFELHTGKAIPSPTYGATRGEDCAHTACGVVLVLRGRVAPPAQIDRDRCARLG